MQKKRVALIAHDSKKAEIVEWCLNNKSILEKFELCGTGTTAKRISEATGLQVKGYLSGPLGGDQQIGALVAEGKIDCNEILDIIHSLERSRAGRTLPACGLYLNKVVY